MVGALFRCWSISGCGWNGNEFQNNGIFFTVERYSHTIVAVFSLSIFWGRIILEFNYWSNGCCPFRKIALLVNGMPVTPHPLCPGASPTSKIRLSDEKTFIYWKYNWRLISAYCCLYRFVTVELLSRFAKSSKNFLDSIVFFHLSLNHFTPRYRINTLQTRVL